MKNQLVRGNTHTNQSLAFVAGLLAGSLTGAVTMWLMAPRAGEKTRARLEKQGKKLGRQAVEGLEAVVIEASEKANEFTDSVRHEVGELQHNAQELMETARK